MYDVGDTEKNKDSPFIMTQLSPAIFDIIAGWRIRYDIQEAVSTFVLVWAYAHSNKHPVDHPLLQDDQFNTEMCELAHELQQSMADGQCGVLGKLMEEVGLSDRKLMPSEFEIQASIDVALADHELYEPYVDNGGSLMIKVHRLCETLSKQGKLNYFANLNLKVEDRYSVNCAAVLIQLLYQFDYLTGFYGQSCHPASLTIANVDSMNRQFHSHGQHYSLSFSGKQIH